MEAYYVYEWLALTDDQKANTADLLEALQLHCVEDVNEVYERYVFYCGKQTTGESVDVSLADLKRLARLCDAETSMIRDRTALGIASDATRKKLLGTRETLTFSGSWTFVEHRKRLQCSLSDNCA